MIETEEQRRWWFATHPEYSWSRRGAKKTGRKKETKDPDKVSPEAVDAYVDEALKHERNETVIEILKELKFWCGTEFASQSPAEQEELLREDEFDWDDDPVDESDEQVPHGEDPQAQGREGGIKWQDQRLAQGDRPRPPSDNGASGGGRDSDKEESTFWETVVTRIDDTFQYWEGLAGVDLGLANPSRKLARNLEEAGRPRPPGHHAHHIVPVYDKRFPEAEEARSILKNFKIGISSADNGVWLPGKPGIGPGAYHPGLHSREYYRQVRDSLRQTTTKQEAIQTLQHIGRQLSKGTFLR